MHTTGVIDRIRLLLSEVGPRETALRLGRHLYRRAFPLKLPVHPFDLRYGVDTSGLIGGSFLASGHISSRHITAYWGTAPSGFQHALACWSQCLLDGPYSCGDYAFIDLGCGKGRAVMLASDLPFGRVLGVEIDPILASIAQSNLAKWMTNRHTCHDVAVLHADALEIALPECPTLLYVFHPLQIHGTQLLLARLQSLLPARSTPIDIIYMSPVHADLFALVQGLHLLREGTSPLNAEEMAVDAFHVRALDYRIYRLPPLTASFSSAAGPS